MSLGMYRTLTLAIGDAILLGISLVISLLLRYGPDNFWQAWELNRGPFAVIFALWLLIFYIAQLYEARRARDIPTMLQTLIYALLVGGFVAMGLFYLVPAFTIAPKINLLLTIACSGILLGGWHSFFLYSMKVSSKIRVCLLGASRDIEELSRTIAENPQLGYVITIHADHIDAAVRALLEQNAFDIVVAPREMQSDNMFVQSVFDAMRNGIKFADVTVFYEHVLGKIPVSLISKAWFLENIAETEKIIFRAIKRSIDFLFALILGIGAIILLPFVALAIRLDSSGPIFLRQKRVGEGGKIYTHYKYRTMVALGPDGHAEPNGVKWAEKNDARITRVGKFLRSTRIDELPQVWNILRGELSFIGPRPERPEFVEQLKKEIPFYDMRHLVRPGLSGWAQINPPYYYASIDETMLKLQYDLFYIKNRDLGLDLAIALKTLTVILSRQGR